MKSCCESQVLLHCVVITVHDTPLPDHQVNTEEWIQAHTHIRMHTNGLNLILTHACGLIQRYVAAEADFLSLFLSLSHSVCVCVCLSLSLSLLFLSSMSCGSSEFHPRLFRPYVLPCLFLTIPPTHTHVIAHAVIHPHAFCRPTETWTRTRIQALTQCARQLKHGQHVSLLSLHWVLFISVSCVSVKRSLMKWFLHEHQWSKPEGLHVEILQWGLSHFDIICQWLPACFACDPLIRLLSEVPCKKQRLEKSLKNKHNSVYQKIVGSYFLPGPPSHVTH